MLPGAYAIVMRVVEAVCQSGADHLDARRRAVNGPPPTGILRSADGQVEDADTYLCLMYEAPLVQEQWTGTAATKIRDRFGGFARRKWCIFGE